MRTVLFPLQDGASPFFHHSLGGFPLLSSLSFLPCSFHGHGGGDTVLHSIPSSLNFLCNLSLRSCLLTCLHWSGTCSHCLWEVLYAFMDGRCNFWFQFMTLGWHSKHIPQPLNYSLRISHCAMISRAILTQMRCYNRRQTWNLYKSMK